MGESEKSQGEEVGTGVGLYFVFNQGEKERILLMSKKIKKNKSLKQIAEELEDTTENVQPVYDAICKMSADFDVEDIYRKIYSRDCEQDI